VVGRRSSYSTSESGFWSRAISSISFQQGLLCQGWHNDLIRAQVVDGADLPHSNILAGLAGITSDANSLVNFSRNSAQRHLFTYDEDIPVEMLVQRLCDMKQGYTQFGGMSWFTRCGSMWGFLLVRGRSSTPVYLLFHEGG
jgi:hypothetical protein